MLDEGARWAVVHGYGSDADPGRVSDRALERGRTQLGTLGSGNHFAELPYVSEIHDKRNAGAFGLVRDQVTVMIHSGSRGLGHQVCTDHLKVMLGASRRYRIDLPDRVRCRAAAGGFRPPAAPSGPGSRPGRPRERHKRMRPLPRVHPGDKTMAATEVPAAGPGNTPIMWVAGWQAGVPVPSFRAHPHRGAHAQSP